MGTVIITITDNEDGTTGIVSEPSVPEMNDMLRELVEKKTPVAGSVMYAMRMMTAAVKKSTDFRTEKLEAHREPEKKVLGLFKKKKPQ